MNIPIWCMAVARALINDPEADERLIERVALSLAIAHSGGRNCE